MSDNIQQMIVDLLNQASIYGKDAMRVQHLRHVQELILRKDPTLLEYFLEDVLAFQTDKSVEVKKTIISFIEEACQLNPQIIIKVVDNLYFLLHDENLFVRKKLLLSLIPIYKSTIIWLTKIPSIDQTVQQMWRIMMNIKDHIIAQLNGNNDGFCLAVVKFIEMLVITFIQHEQDFPVNVTGILSRTQCKQDEKDLIEKLTAFVLSQHSSHVQLIAAIEALTSIVRYRIDHLRQILSTFKVLHANLSASFTDSQIDNIHKMMKLKLFNLLKFSVPPDSQSEIINLLTNLGSTQSEIDKYLPKQSSESKRKSAMNSHTQISKKSKHIDENSHHGPEKPISLNKVPQSSHQQQTVANLVGKLSIENVVDLVLASMHSLPETIPLSFQSTYTPIKDAGSPAQIEYLAHLLSNQLIAAGHDLVKHHHKRTIADGNKLSSVSTKKTKSYKLFNAVKPIDHHERQRMSMDSFNRILDAQNQCEKIHLNRIHRKIVLSLVCAFEDSFRDTFRQYLFTDIHQRYDLAFAWIYQEYARANGYLVNSKTHQRKDYSRYDHLLCQILSYLQENSSDLFSHLLKNVPFITDNVLLIVERYCQNENSSNVGMKILHHLIIHRRPSRDKCLDILLNLTQNENNSIRDNAIHLVKTLYERKEFQQTIDNYILQSLKVSQTLETVFDVSNDIWPENSIARYFSLCLNLIPMNHRLVQLLTNFYTTVNPSMQRMICQIVENPIRQINTIGVEIFELIQNCPKDTEPMIIHIIHLLTERLMPSTGLLESIRIFFHERTIDVRFLIPLLPYLGTREIKCALSTVIKLPSPMVNEVFNKLLHLKSFHADSVSPSELFIALHEISLDECKLKMITHATTLCLNERSIYTDTVLVEIIEHLVEITPIPLLFMRTVLQTLTLYPKMVSFIMKILQRLIIKQVWQQTRVWEGFIKCCEITRPHSLPLLLQLPVPQLKDVCQTAVTLRTSLRSYLRSMSITQRSSIPSSILEVIDNHFENLPST